MTRITYNVHGQPKRPTDWRDNALCASSEYEGQADLWFAYPTNQTATTKATQVCNACPVRVACLKAALREEGSAPLDKRSGIRGGLTAAERLQAYRQVLAARKRESRKKTAA